MKKPSKPLSDNLHVGTAERAPALADLVDRIVAIAKMSATDLATLMGTEEGASIARLDIVEAEGVAPESYLRPWNSIGRASPAALTESQYDKFLTGENPLAAVERKSEPLEIYGAHLEREA